MERTDFVVDEKFVGRKKIQIDNEIGDPSTYWVRAVVDGDQVVLQTCRDNSWSYKIISVDSLLSVFNGGGAWWPNDDQEDG